MTRYALWLTAVLSLIPALASAAPRYSVTDLGNLGGDESVAYAINNQGQIVGGADTGVRGKDGEYDTWVFLWQNGQKAKIPALPGRKYYANGINDAGVIVGAYSPNPGTGQFFPYVYRNGKVHLLKTTPGHDTALAGSGAYAINGQGLIVGETHGRACLWKSERVRTLPVPSGFGESRALAVNAPGWVVGFGASPKGLYHDLPMLWRGGQGTVLPLPGRCTEGEAQGVNNPGQVVGWALRPPTPALLRSSYVAWMWQGGKTRPLPVPPGYVDARAFALNNRGDAVGHGVGKVVRKGNERAILWRGGRAYVLNDLIPKNTGWVLEEGLAINDHGWIIGNGKHHGVAHAFLLRPAAH